MQRKTSSHQSGACAPGGQGGFRPHARVARASPAPSGQGGAPAAHQSSARAPVGRGAPAACQSGACAPGPRIPSFEFTYPEMQRKHIPRVNEYQS